MPTWPDVLSNISTVYRSCQPDLTSSAISPVYRSCQPDLTSLAIYQQSIDYANLTWRPQQYQRSIDHANLTWRPQQYQQSIDYANLTWRPQTTRSYHSKFIFVTPFRNNSLVRFKAKTMSLKILQEGSEKCLSSSNILRQSILVKIWSEFRHFPWYVQEKNTRTHWLKVSTTLWEKRLCERQVF